MPPKKRAQVISLVQRKLTSANSNSKATRTLTNPNHDWMFPPGDLQRSPYIPPMEQRVEQRVAADTELLPPVIQCITDAPPIMDAPNPTTKCTLHLIKCTHMQRTQNNVRTWVCAPHNKRSSTPRYTYASHAFSHATATTVYPQLSSNGHNNADATPPCLLCPNCRGSLQNTSHQSRGH
jgi:hypothetical protein